VDKRATQRRRREMKRHTREITFRGRTTVTVSTVVVWAGIGEGAAIDDKDSGGGRSLFTSSWEWFI
jgi:hypothetical protein